MENKRLIKLFTVISVLMIISFLLASCKLPASEGPSGGEDTTDATFPVPGETEQDKSGIDVDLINTQTAIAELMQTSVVIVDTPPAAVTTSSSSGAALVTPAPVVVDIKPTAGLPETYTLQNGEWPFCIARRFDVDQYELLNINGLTLTSQPSVGFTMKIPQTGNNFSGDLMLKKHPADYTVKAGDTIYTIACDFGDVSPDMIALANNLSAPYDLTTGQTIRIP